MNLRIAFLLFLAIALGSGCKSSTNISDDELGTLRGKVALSDGDCNPILNGTGTAVSIEGTGFSTTTDATGQWEIDHIPAGIYNIIIAKPGFDTGLVTQYQFSGSGTQFLENEGIHALLTDSVFISSIAVTERDSLRPYTEETFDSVNHRLDTISGIDTEGHEYDLAITISMAGPDSAIYKLSSYNEASVKDITTPYAEKDQTYSTFQANASISRNMVIAGHYGFIAPIHLQSLVHRGDTMLLTISYTNACGETGSATKTFVIP